MAGFGSAAKRRYVNENISLMTEAQIFFLCLDPEIHHQHFGEKYSFHVVFCFSADVLCSIKNIKDVSAIDLHRSYKNKDHVKVFYSRLTLAS